MFLHYNNKQLYTLTYREPQAVVCDLLDIAQAMEMSLNEHLVCSIDESHKTLINDSNLLHYQGFDCTLYTIERLTNIINEAV